MINYYEQKAGKKEVKNKNKRGLFNKDIFKHQFKVNLKGFLTVSLVVGALMVLVLALYPTIQDVYASMLAMMPPEMIDVFNAMAGNMDTIANYYLLEGGQIYVLVGAIYAASLGVGLIRKEIKNGSAEFLYSEPVSKGTIFRSKFLVLVLNILLFNIIVTAIGFGAMYIIEGSVTFDIVNFFTYIGLATLIHLQIGVIALAYAGLFKKNASVGLMVGLAVLVYILSIISQLTDSVQFLQYLTPFTYILQDIMEQGFASVDLPTLIGWSGASLLLLIVSHMSFKRTDIL